MGLVSCFVGDAVDGGRGMTCHGDCDLCNEDSSPRWQGSWLRGKHMFPAAIVDGVMTAWQSMNMNTVGMVAAAGSACQLVAHMC